MRARLLIAVNRPPLFVDNQNAVSVAVERDANIRPHFQYLPTQSFGRRRPHIPIDIKTVRLDADGNHLSPEFPEGLRSDFVRGAISAIDYDPQPLQRQVARRRAFDELNIASSNTVDPLGAANVARTSDHRERAFLHQRFDLHFLLISQFETVRPE